MIVLVNVGQLPVYELHEWEIDLSQRRLRFRGAPVPLGGRAFEILAVLVRSAGELVTKDALMAEVWPGAVVEDSTLQVHISAIRKSLGAARGMLQTSSGRGYQLRGGWSIREERRDADRPLGTAALPPELPFKSNIPAARSHLVGRKFLLSLLHDVISAYRAVTLTGPGGIGKTVLAMQVARDLLPSYGGAGVVVELAGLADSRLVPSSVASALALPAGNANSVDDIARAIGDRKLLLILDNCEHVIDAVAEVAELILRRCSGATVLSTSREVLRVDGEYVSRIPPLDVPLQDDANPESLRRYGAIQLFIGKVLALQPDFKAEGESLSLVAAICRQLDGIPLALEFAAARAAALGLRETVTRLDNRFELLTNSRRTALPRHQTLRAVFEWSHDLLPEPEQTLLHRLAIFVTGFTVGAAIAIMRETGTTEAYVINGLAALADKSLLMLDNTGEEQRWHMLETVRAYALERLQKRGDFAAAARAHAAYFRDLFEAPEDRDASVARQAISTQYGRELDNVRAALDWAFASNGDAKLGVDLTIAVVPLLIQLSLLTECNDRVGRALGTLGDDPGVARARMRLSAGLGGR